MRLSYRYLFFALVSALATPAFATKDVSSPTVSEDVLKTEMRYGLEQDDESASRDGRFRQTYLAEYGVTKWWATRFNFKLSKPDGKPTDYTATEWENKFQLFNEKDDGFNGAFKIVYAMADNDDPPDSIELKLMAEKKFGIFNQRVNLSFKREVGPESDTDTALGMAWQMLAPIDGGLSGGLEWFGEFGPIGNIPSWDEQDQMLGPVFQYKATDMLSFESGYLFGISDAASDGLFKFFVKMKF